MRFLLLAPGPSLKAYNGSRKGYSVVIGVNRVVTKYEVDWWVTGDDHAFDWFLPHAQALPKRLFTLQTPGPRPSLPPKWEQYWDETGRMTWWVAHTLYPHPPRKSGVAALLLSWFLGATHVTCYGVDMAGNEEFDGSPIQPEREYAEPARRWDKEIMLWDNMVKAMKADGVKVVRKGLKDERDW
jgi:hypothetical protein